MTNATAPNDAPEIGQSYPKVRKGTDGRWVKLMKGPSGCEWWMDVRSVSKNWSHPPEIDDSVGLGEEAAATAMGNLLNLVDGILPDDLITCLREVAESVVRKAVAGARHELNGQQEGREIAHGASL